MVESPHMQPWMIYGANGYTGELIAREAVAQGFAPVLAGRDQEKIGALADELGLQPRVFGLDAPRLSTELAGVRLVLNCAGPFSKTAEPLMDAAIAAKAHYLDITGEIGAIEAAASRRSRAAEAGVTLLPAVGFDVVPSDCLARHVADELPRASTLKIAFTDTGGISPGTAKTVLENMPRGGLVRSGGELRRVSVAWKAMRVPFATGPKWAMTIPWGDVASAYYSTGIPNIETYIAQPRGVIRGARILRPLLPIVGLKPVAGLLAGVISHRVHGPDEAQRLGSRASFWAEASDSAGNRVTATLETPSGYELTRLSAVICCRRVLAGEAPAGFSTPAMALGKRLILEVPGTRLEPPVTHSP